MDTRRNFTAIHETLLSRRQATALARSRAILLGLQAVILRVLLCVALTCAAVGLESLRPQFYYAATPYLYPLFYLFASVFMGPGWGLLTALSSLVLINALIEPADALGWGQTLTHCALATWMGLQAQRPGAAQLFTIGLRFWLWFGLPLLCVITIPYFREYFWAGATIVLQELISNLLCLVLFSLAFYSLAIRKRLAPLKGQDPTVGRHSLRYSVQLGAASLVIFTSTVVFVLDRIIDHDAGNSLFSQASKISASLHNYRTQDRSLTIHYEVERLLGNYPDDMGSAAANLQQTLEDFPAICSSVLGSRSPSDEAAVIDPGCLGERALEIREMLLNGPALEDIIPINGRPQTAPRLWPAIIASDNYILYLTIDSDVIAQRANGSLGDLGRTGPNQFGMAPLTAADYLNVLEVGPSNDPWGTREEAFVEGPNYPGRHFFLQRLQESFSYEFPAYRGPAWSTSGIKVSFPSRAFTEIQLREAGIFLSTVVTILLLLMFVIRNTMVKEIAAIEDFGSILESFPNGSDSSLLETEPEIAEIDGLRQNIAQLLAALGNARTEQQATLLTLENRASQLTGMVEQSRAFLMILTQSGELVTDNSNARSEANVPLRRSVTGAVQAHYRGGEVTTDDPIARATLRWLRSGKPHHFGEIETAVADADEPRNLTLQLGIIAGPEHTYSIRIEDISDLIATKKQLAHTARLAELGELATGVAHELNQPLHGIGLAVSNIAVKQDRDSLSDAYLKEKLDRIRDQIERASNIIGDLKSFGRAEKLNKAPVKVSTVIARSVDMVSAQFELAGVTIETVDRSEGHAILANSQQIEQVLLNLFNNARHVMQKQGGGRLTVTAEHKSGQASITVHDTGPGIHGQLREKIFTPFFTTKLGEGGTGLGLSISYRLIEENGGTLRLLDSNIGAAFEILLPVTDQEVPDLA